MKGPLNVSEMLAPICALYTAPPPESPASEKAVQLPLRLTCGLVSSTTVPYANWSAVTRALVLPPTVTVTGTTPVPGGLIALQLEVVGQLTEVAGVPPNMTVVKSGPVEKPVPVIATVVPPPSGPKPGASPVTVGGKTGGVPSASLPEPKRLSFPGAPRSTARPSRNDWSCDGVNVGFASRTSAAAPATCGDDADVPRKPALQPEAAPRTEDDVASGPTRSGFVRPSIVGPWLLNASKASACQQMAPTVMTLGDVPGSITLPAATTYWSVPTSMTRSRRGLVFAENLSTSRPKVWLAPVLFE